MLLGVRWQAAQRANDCRCLGVSQKKLTLSIDAKRALLEPDHPDLSLRQ